jgi:tRNA(fMet)-specific endonuclease VapC
MINYLWDTNILLHYMRNSEKFNEWNQDYAFLGGYNRVFLSVINIGEIESLAYQLNWGELRRQRLQAVVNQSIVLNIFDETIQAYAEIDAFSQGKLPNRPLGMSARSMGKNDIWLAATAHIGNLKFVTTDNDFNHLNDVFIDLLKLSPII